MTSHETSLMQALLGGRGSASDRAYREVEGWIRQVLDVCRWDAEITAGEVISDTFFKLLRNLRENAFEGRSSLKTYVQRIARLTIIDLARARKRARAVADHLPAAGTPTPEDLLLEEERARLFQRLLHRLKAQCRELWHLVFSEGLRYREIAERQSVQEGTIKARMSRCKEEATRLLREMM